MDPSKFVCVFGLLLIGGLCAADARAQLFGSRTLGNPLMRQNAPGGGEFGAGTGTLQGNERFLRGNRSADDFVGAANREEVGFVGQVNALNLDPSQIPALLGMRPRQNRSGQINRPLQKRRPNSLLEPRLELGFVLPPEQQQRLADAAANHLGKSFAARFESPIEVSVAGRTATLRGEVDSADAARLAETLARLEPGISEVRNELQVRAPAGEHSNRP